MNWTISRKDGSWVKKKKKKDFEFELILKIIQFCGMQLKEICFYKLFCTSEIRLFFPASGPAHFPLSIYFQAFTLMVIGLDINEAKTVKWSRAWFSSQPTFKCGHFWIWLLWHLAVFNSKVIPGLNNKVKMTIMRWDEETHLCSLYTVSTLFCSVISKIHISKQSFP